MKPLTRFLLSTCTLLVFNAVSCAHAAVPGPGRMEIPDLFLDDALAMNSLLAQDETQTRKLQEPESGALVVPGTDAGPDDHGEKKCMTVCKQWGEDCIIDPRQGRKCRRTCKDFGEECF